MNNELINALRVHLADMLEEEVAAKDAGNDVFLQGLQFARVNLEVTLERHGISRVSTLEHK